MDESTSGPGLLVRDLMTTPVVTLTAGQRLPVAQALLRLRRFRHLPVVDGDSVLVGLVTHRDLLAAGAGVLAPLDPADRAAPHDGVPVDRVMHTDVWTVSPDAPATAAVRLLKDHRFGCLPVVEEARLVGIVTEADFLDLAAGATTRPAHPPDQWTAETAMTPAPRSVTARSTLGQARALMMDHTIRHLPIVDGDTPIGMISDRDLRVAEAILGGTAGAEEVAVSVLGFDPVYTVERTARLSDVATQLAARRIGSALVVDDGKLVGIITTTDICQILSDVLK